MNLSPSEHHDPNPASESHSSTASSPVETARVTSNSHSLLARYTRVYDRALDEGASVAEAMALVDSELVRELEQSRRRVA